LKSTTLPGTNWKFELRFWIDTIEQYEATNLANQED